MPLRRHRSAHCGRGPVTSESACTRRRFGQREAIGSAETSSRSLALRHRIRRGDRQADRTGSLKHLARRGARLLLLLRRGPVTERGRSLPRHPGDKRGVLAAGSLVMANKDCRDRRRARRKIGRLDRVGIIPSKDYARLYSVNGSRA